MADQGHPRATARCPFVSPSTLPATRGARPHVGSATRTPPRDTGSSVRGSRGLQPTFPRSRPHLSAAARRSDEEGRCLRARPVRPCLWTYTPRSGTQARGRALRCPPGSYDAHRHVGASPRRRYSERVRDASSISTPSPSRSGPSCGDGRIRTSGRVSPLQPLSRRLLSATQPRLRGPS